MDTALRTNSIHSLRANVPGGPPLNYDPSQLLLRYDAPLTAVIAEASHPSQVYSNGAPPDAVGSPHADHLGGVRSIFFVLAATLHVGVDAAPGI